MTRGTRGDPRDAGARGHAASDDVPPEPRPPLGSWRALYALIVFDLLLVIALCGWLSRLGR